MPVRRDAVDLPSDMIARLLPVRKPGHVARQRYDTGQRGRQRADQLVIGVIEKGVTTLSGHCLCGAETRCELGLRAKAK